MYGIIRSLAALGAAAACGLTPVAGQADTLDHAFLVTTTVQTAGGTTAYRDVLVVHGTTGTGFIAGGNAADPAAMERDRSCFDVVGRVLTAGAGRKPYAIGVALDAAHVVPVSMTGGSSAQPADGTRVIVSSGDAGGTLTAAGGGAVTIGVHVDARVVAQNDRLQAATIRELTFVGDTSQTLAVTGCSLQRLPAAALPTNAAPQPA